MRTRMKLVSAAVVVMVVVLVGALFPAVASVLAEGPIAPVTEGYLFRLESVNSRAASYRFGFTGDGLGVVGWSAHVYVLEDRGADFISATWDFGDGTSVVERWSLSTSHTWETPGPKTVQVTIQRSSGTKILSGVVDVCHFYQMEMFELSAENGGLATIEFDIPNLVGDPNALAVAHREAWYPFPRSVARWAGQTDTDRARVFRNGEASPFFEAPYPPSSGRTWPYMSTVYFAPRSKLTFKLIAPQNGSATFQGFISGFLWKNWGVPMIGAEQKGNMSGCVFDAVGGGVANVVVRVGSPDGKTAYEPVVTSGPDGSFTFIGLPSGYQYRFWPEGRPELGVTVEVSGSTSGADINLP